MCAVVLVLLWPVVGVHGFGLHGDLVFAPRHPLNLDAIGLGSRLPRAVPLDAVLGLLTSGLPGELVFRVAVLAGPLLAGLGALRLLEESCSVPARLAAATFAVWNPYVVERIALGQWALLLGYGATVMLAWTIWHHRAEPSARLVLRMLPWLGLASLTPTGGIVAVVLGTVLGASSRSRGLLVAGVGALVQLPWVVPALLAGGASMGDPGGVAVFRANADAPGGVWVSVLGLGGIWDAGSAPASRGSLLGVVAAVLVVTGVGVGLWRLPALCRRLAVPAALGLVLALAPTWGPTAEALQWMTEELPGAGLLRDSQKWLVLALPLVICGVGALFEAVLSWCRRTEPSLVMLAGVVGVLLPLIVLPDATASTWPVMRPVHYPVDFTRVQRALADDPGHGAVALAPWRAYRRFEWGNQRTANDPAYAWFDASLIGSDDLVVGGRTVEGGSRRAERVRLALTSAAPAQPLAAEAVGWVLVYRDDPQVAALSLDGLETVVDGSALALYRVPGPVPAQSVHPRWVGVAVVFLDSAILLMVVLSIFAVAGRWPVTVWRRNNPRRNG